MQFQYSRVGYICLKRKDTFGFPEFLLKSVSSVFMLKFSRSDTRPDKGIHLNDFLFFPQRKKIVVSEKNTIMK